MDDLENLLWVDNDFAKKMKVTVILSRWELHRKVIMHGCKDERIPNDCMGTENGTNRKQNKQQDDNHLPGGGKREIVERI